jgi:pre-mRNA-splicing helicase BRR2
VEREKIEAEMAGNPDLVRILDQLRATRTSAKERQNAMERNIR